MLGLNINNFKALSYPIEEIILEKYRALLTRNSLKERDLFDIYLIQNSLNVKSGDVVEKIGSSSLIKRELTKTIAEKLNQLNKGQFFNSDEQIEDLATIKYDLNDFNNFKDKIKLILIQVCEEFLKKE